MLPILLVRRVEFNDLQTNTYNNCIFIPSTHMNYNSGTTTYLKYSHHIIKCYVLV